MFYKVYLDGFTNEDGSVNWLPGAASVEGILANTELLMSMEYSFLTIMKHLLKRATSLENMV